MLMSSRDRHDADMHALRCNHQSEELDGLRVPLHRELASAARSCHDRSGDPKASPIINHGKTEPEARAKTNVAQNCRAKG
jgi:hypothetical protein